MTGDTWTLHLSSSLTYSTSLVRRGAVTADITLIRLSTLSTSAILYWSSTSPSSTIFLISSGSSLSFFLTSWQNPSQQLQEKDVCLMSVWRSCSQEELAEGRLDVELLPLVSALVDGPDVIDDTLLLVELLEERAKLHLPVDVVVDFPSLDKMEILSDAPAGLPHRELSTRGSLTLVAVSPQQAALLEPSQPGPGLVVDTRRQRLPEVDPDVVLETGVRCRPEEWDNNIWGYLSYSYQRLNMRSIKLNITGTTVWILSAEYFRWEPLNVLHQSFNLQHWIALISLQFIIHYRHQCE